MKTERANELLEKWVGILGLQDWQIKLACDVLPCDMQLQDCDGETEWTECRKTARIQILDEKCYGERIVPYNFERILIHELLHLKLSLLGESGNDLQDRYVHQLIDDLARAFCEAAQKGGDEEAVKDATDVARAEAAMKGGKDHA